MTDRRATPFLRSLLLLIFAIVAGACGEDATGPRSSPSSDSVEIGVVLNSVDVSLTLFLLPEAPGDIVTIGLGPDGSPVGFSHRGNIVAVPLGTVPAVAVVDLRARPRRLVRTVGLPQGSGATGSAFVSDSVVFVANPNLNSVSPVNVFRGTVGEPVGVGAYPSAVAAAGGRVYVANGNLVDFAPAGPGSLTVLDAASRSVVDSVALSGINPTDVTVGPEGRIWVLHSGVFGEGNGSVSVVDPATLEETAHHDGFGEFPGSLTFGPEGLLHVGSFSYGLAIWDPGSGAFVRSPDDPVNPKDVTPVPDVAFDEAGRTNVVVPILPGQDQACFQPGGLYMLDSAYEVVGGAMPVGTCPVALEFVRFAP